ncbi:MAG TPA: hypothetical protein VEI28_05575 [Thermodesulfovibrionales bacterium]|nr:hypothetical protein [Thermodesulfovibrionales bacterium]
MESDFYLRKKVKGIGVSVLQITGVALCLFLFTSNCAKSQFMSAWERHCAACHDGETVLNGKVLLNREGMKAKYKTLDEFVNACEGSGACMNILKHQRKLLREVGKELGISAGSQK